MEHRAFPILFEFYQEYSGRYKHLPTAAELICKDLNVALGTSDKINSLEARLNVSKETAPDSFSILAVRQAGQEHRGLVIYHELAHWRLLTMDPFFARQRRSFVLETEVEIKEEYWCDAFAVAMLFAWAGQKVLSKENCDTFFAAGTESSAGDLEYRKLSRDIHCGNRIFFLNEKHFSPPHEGFITLATDLLVVGAKNLRKATE